MSAIVVSAPSGAGKSTVLREVLRQVGGLRFSVSHTTRAPRSGERDGVEYHFVDLPSFDRLIADQALLEWADVHGHRYGTALREYELAARAGVDLILDLDVQGAAQVRQRLAHAVTVFILPPSRELLESRLRGRGLDDEGTVRRRLEAAGREIARFVEYDYVVVNDDLDRCVETLKAVLRATRHRRCVQEVQARRILGSFPVAPDADRVATQSQENDRP